MNGTDNECSKTEHVLRSNEIIISETYATPKGKYSFESTKFLREEEKTLFYFCKGKNIPALRYLTQFEISINTLDEERLSPLHIACRRGSSRMIEEILSFNANYNIPDIFGWTPLHVACFYQRLDVVEMLLKRGASPLFKDRDGVTAFDLLKNEKLKSKFTRVHVKACEGVTLNANSNIKIRVNHSKKRNLSFSKENAKKQSSTVNVLQNILRKFKQIPKKPGNLKHSDLDESISIDYECSFLEELLEDEKIKDGSFEYQRGQLNITSLLLDQNEFIGN